MKNHQTDKESNVLNNVSKVVPDHLSAIVKHRNSNNGRDRGEQRTGYGMSTYIVGTNPEEIEFNLSMKVFDNTYGGLGSGMSRTTPKGDSYSKLYDNFEEHIAIQNVLLRTIGRKLTAGQCWHFITGDEWNNNAGQLYNAPRTITKGAGNICALNKLGMPTTVATFNQWFDNKNNGKVVDIQDKTLPKWFMNELTNLIPVWKSYNDGIGDKNGYNKWKYLHGKTGKTWIVQSNRQLEDFDNQVKHESPDWNNRLHLWSIRPKPNEDIALADLPEVKEALSNKTEKIAKHKKETEERESLEQAEQKFIEKAREQFRKEHKGGN